MIIVMSSPEVKEIMEGEIKAVMDKEVRPLLALEGGDIELVSVEDGVVKVRFRGACAGCLMSQITLTGFVEGVLKKKVPGIKEVTLV